MYVQGGRASAAVRGEAKLNGRCLSKLLFLGGRLTIFACWSIFKTVVANEKDDADVGPTEERTKKEKKS